MKATRKVIGVVMDDGNLQTMSQRMSFALLPPLYKNGKKLDMKFEIKLENIPHGENKPMERITFRTKEGRKIGLMIQNLIASFLLYQAQIGNDTEIAQRALLYNIQAGIELANQKLREWGIGKQATLPVEEM